MAGTSSSWAVLVAGIVMSAASTTSAAVISDPLADGDSSAEGTFSGRNGHDISGGGTDAQPRRLRRNASQDQLSLARSIVQTENARAGTAARIEGRKKTLDLLAERVYSGAAATGLDDSEKTLGRYGDPALADLQGAKEEISEYYWRQLRYAAQSHSYMYEEVKADHPDLPSEIECTATPHCGGPEKSVVVEFQYNVECSGYVNKYDLAKLDYAILEEAASAECADKEFEWLGEDDRSRRLVAESLEAGPNSVLDILHELDNNEDVNEGQGSTNDDRSHRRKLEILTINADPKDKLSGDGQCKPQNKIAMVAKCCEERTGYVTVTYNQCNHNPNEEEVVANVLRKVKDAMDNDNSSIFDSEKGNIVDVVYAGPNLDYAANFATSQEMINASSYKTGALAGAIIGMLALLALLALLVARRRRRADTKDQTVGTDGGESYVTADYGNLGGRHSKLDVHVCKSSLCKECNSNGGHRGQGGHGGSQQCLPVVEEESDQIIRDLAAIRDRDVVFLRTQGTARGQTTEHVDIDIDLGVSQTSSASTASSSTPPSTPPRTSSPRSPPRPSPGSLEGPAYVEQEEITASLDINRVGSTVQSRII